MSNLPLICILDTKIAISKDEDARTIVNITICNAGQFPMKSVAAEIDFVPVQTDCDGIVHCDSQSSTRLLKNISTPAQSLFQEESELSPGEKHCELIITQPTLLAQYNGTITVSMLSPGTGQKLQVQHKFGLYLVDQVRTWD